MSKSIVNMIKHSTISFIGHILLELFGKTGNWRQVHKQTSSAFCTLGGVRHQNNLLRRKKY